MPRGFLYTKNMKLPTHEELLERCKAASLKRRIVRELRYVPSEVTDAEQRDFLVVTNKAGSAGVLLFGDKIVAFEKTARTANRQGRVEAIICDICATWQRGSNSTVVSFVTPKGSVSHLVCGDFNCSLHVRDLTDQSKLSRTQLREHIEPEQRIARLHARLTHILEDF